MPRRRIHLAGSLCLLAVWAATAFGWWLADAMTPRAEGLQQLLQATPFAELAGEERESFLRDLAARLNQLQPDERRKAQLSPEMQALYVDMLPEERRSYLKWTRPPGAGAMARAFAGMRPDRQRRYLGTAVSDLQEAESRFRDLGTSAAILAELQRKGIPATVEGEVTQRDLELQPVVEQTQRVLQMTR